MLKPCSAVVFTCPKLNARNKQRQQAAERTAINAPMQGTAADIIKRAMIAVDTWLTSDGIDAKMIMQVHDELVFEVKDTETDRLMATLPTLMAGIAQSGRAVIGGGGYG